jgi:hypothetical protein
VRAKCVCLFLFFFFLFVLYVSRRLLYRHQSVCLLVGDLRKEKKGAIRVYIHPDEGYINTVLFTKTTAGDQTKP